MKNLLFWFFIKIFLKGDIEMMAIFFAQRVILGKSDFRTVPRGATNIVPIALEVAVAENLLDSGLPELVPISLGGTAEETVE
jgi:hypothetical protein